MPLSPDEQRRISNLEHRVDELERKDKQRQSDWQAEKQATLEAVRRHVDQAMSAALEPLHADIAELKADQKTQLEYLREAAEERGRRKQREEDAARALEQRKIVVDEKRVDADIATAQRDARTRKWTPYLVLIGVIVTAAGGIIAALLRQ